MAGIAYGAPQQPYGMPPNMYAQPYGRGYAQAAPTGYGAPPPQGNNLLTLQTKERNKPQLTRELGWANPYTYPDPSQQPQPHQPPNGGGQGGY
jgi:hypothetical protein